MWWLKNVSKWTLYKIRSIGYGFVLLAELSLAAGNDLPEASSHLVLARKPQAVLYGLSPSQWQAVGKRK